VRGFLTRAGVPNDQYMFYDGSGLSRQNLVTPHAVVELLKYASQQPWGTAFRDTFPVAGIDGSLADRMKGTPAQGKVHGKTGSLGGVKTLSGYLTTNQGDELAFTILSNNFTVPAKKVTDAIDAIVETIVEDAPAHN
jgi:D-alanyl-D-alanine carboxypeptidase/D-alanyl-D-alanine-endopeptidase (penicillin-binding protein 4)